MTKQKFLSKVIAATVAFNLIGSCAFAETYSLEYLQKLAKDDGPKVVMPSDITSDNWIYETLRTISQKYGLILGSPGEKFDANKALTRKEAAVILVSLVGKIQEDEMQLTDVEKDRVGIIKRELAPEMEALTGRVAKLEGSVTQLEANDKKQWVFGYGEKFKLGGILQFKYNGNLDNDSSNGASNFSIPASIIGVSGQIHKNIKFVANWAPSRYYNGSLQTMMADVYASTDIIPKHELYVGQTRIPIGQEGATSDLKLDLANRSMISRNFGARRDTGIKLAGRFDRLDYYAGVYNGNSYYNASDENSKMDVAGWANLKVLKSDTLGNLTIGGGYAFGNSAPSATAGIAPIAFDTFGWHADYKYKKLGLKYEGAVFDGYRASDVKAGGWNVTGLYDLTNKIQLATRYDYFDPNTRLNQNAISELSGGVNYFMDSLNLKFQLNYVYVKKNNMSDGQKIVAMSQYYF